MKSVFISLVLLVAAFPAFVEAAPVSARYLRFEGYYTSNTSTTQHIGIYEIEAYSGGLNVAKTSTITANSVSPSNSTTYTNYLKDGNTAGNLFYSNRTSPGPATEAAPHWVQMDFGSVKPIDRVKVYLPTGYQVTFGLFLSSDGSNWSQVARYDLVNGILEKDPSAPWVAIESAAMRPGTTFMDVVYRVRDHDDTTVKTRALAFVNGVRSFANVLKPVTFVEGTAANLGDTIAVNVSHTLTWDVGADWDIDLGQVKFEVFALDQRGLLPFDWIAIPAAGGNPALTVSKNAPSDADTLNALFWRYADGDPSLVLASGVLYGNASGGAFNQVPLVNGPALGAYATPYVLKCMNLDPCSEISYANVTARAGLLDLDRWHAADRAYGGISIISVIGSSTNGQTTIPASLTNATAICAGNNHNISLKSDGTVVAWGYNNSGQVTGGASTSAPFTATANPVTLGGNTLTNVTAIAAGGSHSLALKNDGNVVAWGYNNNGQVTGAASSSHPYAAIANPVTLGGNTLTNVIAIAAGGNHSLALKSDGTVVAWGYNISGQCNVPGSLSGVTAIAAGSSHSIALKSDGSVVGWGSAGGPVSNLTNVSAIAAGSGYSLALKIDGTVHGWGGSSVLSSMPAGLSGITKIAAGQMHGMALKGDGSVVIWGNNQQGQVTGVPNSVSPYTSTANPLMVNGSAVTGIVAIAGGNMHSLFLKTKAP